MEESSERKDKAEESRRLTAERRLKITGKHPRRGKTKNICIL